MSVKGGDTLRAGILYDLDRNEVYAIKAEGGTITGEFVEGGSPNTTSATSSELRPLPTATVQLCSVPDILASSRS
ncbi:hypothetical protein ACFP9V_22220 [Deinococcus radiopugnans]|uniref:hypothetical protein n=1 Tax=Deinococcus radiopugnans TaxID=57497 RepID=UPI00361F6F6A